MSPLASSVSHGEKRKPAPGVRTLPLWGAFSLDPGVDRVPGIAFIVGMPALLPRDARRSLGVNECAHSIASAATALASAAVLLPPHISPTPAAPPSASPNSGGHRVSGGPRVVATRGVRIGEAAAIGREEGKNGDRLSVGCEGSATGDGTDAALGGSVLARRGFLNGWRALGLLSSSTWLGGSSSSANSGSRVACGRLPSAAALTLLPLASPLTRLASALLRLPEAGSEAGLGARGSLL